MSLSEDQRRRYARQLLLAEIGDTQQQALCDAQVRFASDMTAGTRRSAAAYLRRAGLQVHDEPAGHETPVGEGLDTARVAQAAGEPAMTAAAEALLGALAAVEAIKQITGVGEAGTCLADVTLSRETS